MERLNGVFCKSDNTPVNQLEGIVTSAEQKNLTTTHIQVDNGQEFRILGLHRIDASERVVIHYIHKTEIVAYEIINPSLEKGHDVKYRSILPPYLPKE